MTIDTTYEQQALKSTIVALLRPIAGFCLRRSLRLQEIIDLLKVAFLEEGRTMLADTGIAPNISRLSLFTGLQRKDIRRLEKSNSTELGSVNLLNRIIGQWQNNPMFSTRPGIPRSLGISGNDSEFAELVRSVSVDVSPYTVLFALEHIKAIEHQDNNVSLLTSVYTPTEQSVEGINMLAEDVRDLISTVEDNLFSNPKVPHLHLTTVYENVCLDQLIEIRKWLLDQGAEFHEKARNTISIHDKDINPRNYAKQGGGRVVVCTFSYVSGETPPNSSKSKDEHDDKQ